MDSLMSRKLQAYMDNDQTTDSKRSSRAIVTVGIHPTRGFGKYCDRFRRTFAEFGCADEIIIWDHRWPPNSPTHQECNYAFKVYAVKEAHRRGHDSVLWLDCSCNAIRSIEPLWARLKRDGHVLVEDANSLGKWTGDRTLEHFGVTRDEAMNLPLMCGTCWGVDFTNERSREFIRRLAEVAVPEHFNGTHVSRNPDIPRHPRPHTEGWLVSNDERCWGHRADETCLSLLARELKMNTHVGIEFVGGGEVTDQACIRSGYDLT